MKMYVLFMQMYVMFTSISTADIQKSHLKTDSQWHFFLMYNKSPSVITVKITQNHELLKYLTK